MKLGIGDRVVARANVPCDGPPPPVGAVGVVVGWMVRFPDHDNTWIFDRDELDPAVIDALGALTRENPCDDVGGTLNDVYGVK